MGWQDDPITVARATPKRQPWEDDPLAQPRTAAGVLDALEAGYQGSATGLAIRRKLPDVVLDPHHSKWYERALSTVGQIVPEIPLMVGGAIGGGAAGTGMAGPVGGILGVGAGAFAVPAAIRTSLVEAYKSGTAQSSGGFLASAKIVLKQTAKEAAVGAATLGVGSLAARGAGALIAPSIGQSVTAQTGMRAIGAAGTTAEIATMPVAAAALEGRLPEPQEFLDAAIVIGGLKASVGIAHKIGDIYAKTGIPPEEVVARAKQDPTIVEDLKLADTLALKAERDTQLRESLVGKNYEQLDAAYKQAVEHNLRVETEAVGKFFGAEQQAAFEALPTRRAKDKWLDENMTDKAQDWVNRRQVAEDIIEQFRHAVNDFDTGSPRELGRSIAVLSRKVDDPDFMRSPEGATFRNALNYAKEQGWNMDDVLAGMRSRAAEWAGNDAGELFARLFREAGKKSDEPVKLPAPPREISVEEVADIPRAFRQAANEDSARNAILEPDAARAFVEKPFAEVPQEPGTPKVKLNVNYDYINSPDEAKAALARASELYGPTIVEQTRGKVSWEQTEAEAKARLSELTGADVRSLLTDREPGTASNAADLLIRRQLLEGAVEDFTTKARSYDPANSAPEAGIQMLAAAERVAMLSAQFQGAASEAGRALNILQNARDTARGAEEVKKLLDMYGRDPAQIAAVMREINNPVAAAKAARAIVKATPWEKVVEAMKSFMISGPVTMMANVIGNATFIPLRPVIDAFAVPLGKMRELAVGAPVERVRAIEPLARVAGNFQGMVDALVLAGRFIEANWHQPMEALRKLDQAGGRKTETQKRAIEGDLGVAIRAPFLTLSIPDMLFRMMIERGEANALAAREAAREGHTPFTRQFHERMAHYRQNLTEKQQAEVEALGQRGTFNADLGKVGQGLQKLVKDSHTEFLFPFIRTSANILKETLRLTPAGPLIDTWRADIKAGGARADKAMAEIVVGGSIAAIVIAYAQAGLITGSAEEPDPDKKRVKLAAGEQPNSIQGADGKWYEYTRLQPLGTLVQIAADFSTIWDAFENPEQRDKVLSMLGVSFASAITNQTMLLGLTSMVRAISEPDRYFERFMQNLAAMPVPGVVSQWSALNDPYMREIHTIMDAVKNRTPARTELEPKVDIWGDFIENRERVGGIGPVRKMDPSDDKVKTEAARLNISVPRTPDHIVLPAAGDRKLGKVELTPQQQTQYAVIAGRKAHEIMEPLVNAPDWDARPDMVKSMIYQRVFEKSREYARAQVVPGDRRAEEGRRIADEITRRMSTP
jgi:hypothetical protein